MEAKINGLSPQQTDLLNFALDPCEMPVESFGKETIPALFALIKALVAQIEQDQNTLLLAGKVEEEDN